MDWFSLASFFIGMGITPVIVIIAMLFKDSKNIRQQDDHIKILQKFWESSTVSQNRQAEALEQISGLLSDKN